jgi:hypothetical protein
MLFKEILPVFATTILKETSSPRGTNAEEAVFVKVIDGKLSTMMRTVLLLTVESGRLVTEYLSVAVFSIGVPPNVWADACGAAKENTAAIRKRVICFSFCVIF